MRFLHTADWQIGMKAAHVGKAGEKVRTARIEAIRRIQDLAKEESVDFVLVAGDTFEDHGVSLKLVAQVGDILAGFDRDVYVIPGNHDPWVPGGVWDYARERWSKRVHILTERKPVQIPGGWLYPCPLSERWSEQDPTEWIPVESVNEIRVGLAHGSLELPLWEGEPNHPIKPGAANEKSLDYLALGDWHSVKEIPGRGGVVRMAYSGTPEPTTFGEIDSGYVLLVEIDAPQARPKLAKRKVGELQWWNAQEDVRQTGDLKRLIKKIEQRPNPERTLVNLRLDGVLFADDAGHLDELSEVLSTRFLYGQMDDANLVPDPADDSWINNLPEGSIREAADRLKKLARDEKNLVARQALLELYRLAN
ncbi:MAG: DNA repair exonuclease [Acidobacteria bacterium]|nr:DNA repair exonuclease [Acidobacteriota bacterium]